MLLVRARNAFIAEIGAPVPNRHLVLDVLSRQSAWPFSAPTRACMRCLFNDRLTSARDSSALGCMAHAEFPNTLTAYK
jgi:hypothetical protein